MQTVGVTHGHQWTIKLTVSVKWVTQTDWNLCQCQLPSNFWIWQWHSFDPVKHWNVGYLSLCYNSGINQDTRNKELWGSQLKNITDHRLSLSLSESKNLDSQPNYVFVFYFVCFWLWAQELAAEPGKFMNPCWLEEAHQYSPWSHFHRSGVTSLRAEVSDSVAYTKRHKVFN